MKRYIGSLNVLFGRDLRETIAPVGLLLGSVVALEIIVRLSPWSRDPEVAPFLTEILGVLITTALAMAYYGQFGDLKKERLRHLLSFPITPAQVLISKMAVCCLLSAVALLVVNGTWFLSRTPGNAADTIGYVIQVTFNMVLFVVLLWSALAVTAIVGRWLMVAIITGALFVSSDVPKQFHPFTLAFPPAAGDQPLYVACLIAAAITIALVIAADRMLTLQPVE